VALLTFSILNGGKACQKEGHNALELFGIGGSKVQMRLGEQGITWKSDRGNEAPESSKGGNEESGNINAEKS